VDDECGAADECDRRL